MKKELTHKNCMAIIEHSLICMKENDIISQADVKRINNIIKDTISKKKGMTKEEYMAEFINPKFIKEAYPGINFNNGEKK